MSGNLLQAGVVGTHPRYHRLVSQVPHPVAATPSPRSELIRPEENGKESCRNLSPKVPYLKEISILVKGKVYQFKSPGKK